MSGSEWPKDPKDPRCPSCGEPVSATASYCMHCEADLPTGTADAPAASTGGATDTGAVTPDDAPMDEADPGMPTRDDDTWGSSSTRRRRDRAQETVDAWVDPDSLFDDVSTVMVGLVAGILVGLVAMLLGVFAIPEPVTSAAVWLGLAAGIAAGLWIGKSHSVFGAIRKAGYALGGLLAAAPLVVPIASDSVAGYLVGAFVLALFTWPVALVVVAAGYLLGKGAGEPPGA